MDMVLVAQLVQGDNVLKNGMFALRFGESQKVINLVRTSAEKNPGTKGRIYEGSTLLYECNDKGEQTAGSWTIKDGNI